MGSDNLPINIITHFYNEQYLLPFWIDWYKRLPVSSVTLIDYSSTDKSCEIIKEQAPDHWNLIKSRNSDFCAIACDKEVMDIESSLEGWKMAVNTTEFLMIPQNLNDYLNVLINDAGKLFPSHWNTNFVFCPSVGIVGEENQNPRNLKEFFSGFNKGYIGHCPVEHETVPINKQEYTIRRSDRIMHKYNHGHYSSGRHGSSLVRQGYEVKSNSMFLAWVGYYPWNQKTIDRKSSIKNRIPSSNIKEGWGQQHQWNIDKLNSIREELESGCGNLVDPFDKHFNNEYKKTYENCLTLL